MGVGEPSFTKSRFLCWSILLASGIIYGSSFSFMKTAAAGGANPLGMVFWFTILAICALAAQLAIVGKLKGLDFKLLRFCVPWGISSVIFPNLLFFYAAKEIQASIIALGIALVPTLTLTGAILLKREKLTLRRCTGICLGAVGVMMILLPKITLPKTDDRFFSLAAFAGAACYAEHRSAFRAAVESFTAGSQRK